MNNLLKKMFTVINKISFNPMKKIKNISPFKKKIIDLVHAELATWKGKEETDPGMVKVIQKYWKNLGINWDDARAVKEAWSAALISWIMKEAGAGKDFKYSPGHAYYITAAIKNRKAKNENPFKGYKPGEVKVEVGDLVCYGRQSGITYDSLAPYPSHCDIVSKVSPGQAESVGGNVSNTVKTTLVPLNEAGKIDLTKAKHPYFVVIKNKK